MANLLILFYLHTDYNLYILHAIPISYRGFQEGLMDGSILIELLYNPITN